MIAKHVHASSIVPRTVMTWSRGPVGTALTALAALAGLVGCEDPSLQVVVVKADGYAELVSRVEVTVYQRDGLSCDDIAFDKLSSDELRAIERASGTGSFQSIPRLGRKAIVARGYGKTGADPASERWILAGCAELDDIAEQAERIEIKTEPVASAAIDARPRLAGKGALDITVVAVDVNQQGINGKQVRWTSYGAAGAFPASGDIDEPSDAMLLKDGELVLQPAAPALAGPYAIQVRVKWSSSLPPPVNGMMANPISLARRLRPIGDVDPRFINACTIYSRAGLPTLACLEKVSASERFIRSYRVQGEILLPAAPPVAAPNAIGLFGLGESVIAINGNGSYAGVINSSLSGQICQAACPAAIEITDVLAFTGCKSDEPSLVALYRDGPTYRLVATLLSSGSKPVAADLLDLAPTLGALGCVTDLGSTAGPQAVVTLNSTNSVSGAEQNTVLVLANGSQISRVREPALLGSGFASAGKEARLLTTEIDPTGFSVVESVLNRVRNAYRLFERRRSPALAPPQHYVSGRFDLDGESDLAWDLPEDNANLDGGRLRRVQLLLAARPGRPPLSGRLVLGANADLLAADLDSDGIDDLIGYDSESVAIQRLGQLGR